MLAARRMCASGLMSPLSVARRAALSAAPGLVSPLSVARRAALGAAPSRLLSSAAPAPGGGASRLRGPITWVSAVVTITGLYSLYQYQYTKQLNRQKSVGKPELGGPFTLMDVDGKTVSDTDLTGQWVLIYFGFTKCPDICPEEMAKVSEVLEGLDTSGRHVLPVFITIDPARDTPARLKSYFETADFHKRVIALTGSHEALQKACRAYRVYFTRPTPEEVARGDYLLDHSIISYLLDPQGNFVEFFGKSLSRAEMETKMAKCIDEWESAKWWDDTLPEWMKEKKEDNPTIKPVLPGSRAAAGR